ncbi:hypothetical protein GALMADRAFT_141321 [Galerina marginata CBS 339.88]|uniref:ubiquitinyl hydrolase 1 n=1 Tax=Galerina marginata (strain CBS 339.88) TaxID=685588 RepID=A0A067SVZ8_GALM3|nr:hypothetical protein GALMADRAFT_141321 [Galerina marginata CBS 339.88]
MADLPPTPWSKRDLEYVLNHVFLPPKLSQEDDTEEEHDIVLSRLVYSFSRDFLSFLPQPQQKNWSVVINMLEALVNTTVVFDKSTVTKEILGLVDGEVLAFHIRAQNAALILRRKKDSIIFEAFEVSPPPDKTMGVKGKLICSYPGPAVELPLNVAQDPKFVEQLSSFLFNMDVDLLPDAAATTTKAGSTVPETRGTTHPRYITQLLIMILHGMGQEAKVKRIKKRIADDVCWLNTGNPWRRSSLWLVLRVAIQTTVDARQTYKEFMVFFQTGLLRLFLAHGFSSDLLHAARVKTIRRVHKLGTSASPRLVEEVEGVSQKIQQHLQAKWSEEQRLQAGSPYYIHNPSQAAIDQDITMSIQESRAYLTNVMHPDFCVNNITSFQPSNVPRLRDIDDFKSLRDGFANAIQDDPYIALADFELFVQERLDGWVTKNRHDESACQVLESCSQEYISTTELHYSTPEAKSLMLLTVMELWVAIDTVAIVHCPLLSKYSPEIPASILDPLLLRRAKPIERAARIERYLRSRHSNATVRHSIYNDNLDNAMFSVRYFQQSDSLQALKASIERVASNDRQEKLKELREMNAKHASRSAEISRLNCTCTYYWNSCYRCNLRKQVNNMDIDVHEWPLPARALEAEVVIFELNCPPVFAIWRTCTYQILRDYGMAHIPHQKFIPKALLENYDGLATWSKGGRSGRITLGSETTSFIRSHYRDVRLPAGEDSVCVKNGLRFRLYDTLKEEIVSSSFDLCLDSYCTLRLPNDGLYWHLQYAVTHTTHTHNETIVNQGDCPVNLSMHEQLAFSNLRCGSQLQWKNIARELRTNTLTFSREEVHSLLTQAAWQVGRLSDDGYTREWHSDLGVPEFGVVLTREAKDLLSRVAANWMERTTVKSIIYLISRLLVSSAEPQQEAYDLLRKARQVTHQWMRDIARRLQDATDDNEASVLQRRVCEIAATCRATFDVDLAHLDALLPKDDLMDDLAILVECSIMVHDNTPPNLGSQFLDFQRLLHRDRRLSHYLESPTIKLLHQSDQSGWRGLDTAIKSVWKEYRPRDKGWKQLPEPNSRWLMTLTTPLTGQQAQQVHYNMLSGKLLVDGKPLGRLPGEIVGHPIYRRIFGQKILDVIPAGLPGMDYATRSLIHGYQASFALRGSAGSRSLIIRAQHAGRVFELVPHDILRKDFPTLFVMEYAHWMDLQSGEVEFRPLDRPWEQSPENWRLLFSSTPNSCRMIYGSAGTRHLIDLRSGIFEDIAACIGPLEASEYLTAVYDAQSRAITIELPRLRLSFFLSDGKLESRNFQGMVIDEDQCTGTMIGLRNQLVLRHKEPTFASLPRSRFVLIPHGDVKFSRSEDLNHVRVEIDTRTRFMRQVTWHKYEVDTDLGLLVGNVSLTSRLFMIYLHALCSHPLPDPLTSQTGTNHALQQLGAAACYSFQKLTEADIELLRHIGGITPSRFYYPKHLISMQSIEWSPQLPALSQHGGFDSTVRSILDYARSLTIFVEAKNKGVDLAYQLIGNPFLMERAILKNVVYYEGGGGVPANLDRPYDSRDSPHVEDHDADGIEALNTSRLVHAWPVGLTRRLGPSELLETFKEWGSIGGPIANASLVYSREWLRVDLAAKWLTIYNLCRRRRDGQHVASKFEFLFSFAALAYSTPSARKLIPVLLAFATTPRSFACPPPHSSYSLADGITPVLERVRSTIASELHNLSNSPAGRLSPRRYETTGEFDERQANYYKATSKAKIQRIVDDLMAQPQPHIPNPFREADDSAWFNSASGIKEYFASCSRNADFCTFISQLTTALEPNYVVSPFVDIEISRFQFVTKIETSTSVRGDQSLTLENLLFDRTATPSSTPVFGSGAPTDLRQLREPIKNELNSLIAKFKSSRRSKLTELYSHRLEESQKKLHDQQTLIICLAYRDQCRDCLSCVLSTIHSDLAPSPRVEQMLENAGLWPPIHPRSLLHLLASTANIRLPPEWVESLTGFAQAYIEYQHSQRLVAYALREEVDNFYKELDNASFNELDAKENPDWLLIQIQGNFITRPIQSAVAREMITPSSGENTVLQLNMGEGKSHVIVPLVAAALADSHKLVRVVVLKPLAAQMFRLLVERLSGLTNRRIFYLPFSRDVKMDVEQIQRIRNLFEECTRSQGVLVAQPEHILSFRLMVIDRIISSGSPLDELAQKLYEAQEWLSSTSRNVLDESDELLHVRYQLIYTMYEQQQLDDGPDRWTTTQGILDLVHTHMNELHGLFPKEVELGKRHVEGAFSHARLLGTLSAQALVSRVAENVLDGALNSLNFVGLSTQPSLRSAILLFITNLAINDQTYHFIEDSYRNTGHWKGLLLLRGLLAHGILVYVLSQQRWRVDYGLDPERSLLAVPYRAKDMPSLRSEFGHPDVAVCLTCLSYYYGGLTASQVREGFKLLLKLDNPPLEYEKWVKRGGADIPSSLRQLIGVNMEDVQTFMDDVVPKFQHNQATIDFFLAQVVFPKEAKEFPFKLSTSGWDLVEEPQPKVDNFTTGFSGTNDNSDLLPTSITQSDPVNQAKTNALVLGYLLQPENDRYICAQTNDGQSCSAKEFLELLVKQPEEVRVLLDVGAQMLEMTNKELVKHWLSLKEDVGAGVFFDDEDSLAVLTRDEMVEPLHSSPFLQQLHHCVIYLDDAHTRGTDLKLPRNFRAAVTLGPKVTKDRLVQGCMRMRKLGHGQCIVFCAPPEIDRRIRDDQGIGSSCPVKSIHVLSWAMSQTCMDIEHHIPHWVQQGVDYNKRRTADKAFAASERADVNLLKNTWLQPAAQTLDEMYGRKTLMPSPYNVAVNEIPAMRERLQLLGVTTVRDAQMEEEQEREVSHELEQEIQMERPPRVKPAVHRLDPDVLRFVQQGIPPSSSTFFPLLTPLRSMTDSLSPLDPWSKQLLCTRDFMTTTMTGGEKAMLSDYLRPVNWIVSLMHRPGDKDGKTIFVVMSPFEVNALQQEFRKSNYVRLHMYAPRTTEAMKPFDDLAFYCVPPLPSSAPAPTPTLDVRCQLNIWAGQLYFDHYETYLQLCLLLGLATSETAGYGSIENDRFVPKEGRVGEMVDVCLFDRSPVALLKTLFGLRRKGMSYEMTHMGKVLHARLLVRRDFEMTDSGLE